MSGASAGLLRSVDEDIVTHFPYHFRSTGSLLGRYVPDQALRAADHVPRRL